MATGEIAFDEPEQRQRFFQTYRQWLVSLATATRDADAFCIGTELDKTVHHEGEWRSVISAAQDWVTRLENDGRGHDRKVLIGELGYDLSPNAALRPWESGQRAPGDSLGVDARVRGAAKRLQGRCLAASLKAIARSNLVVGAFLWKWFPGGQPDSHHEDFLMSTPAMRSVTAKRWGAGRTGSHP